MTFFLHLIDGFIYLCGRSYISYMFSVPLAACFVLLIGDILKGVKWK